jgi:hypothetical protein
MPSLFIFCRRQPQKTEKRKDDVHESPARPSGGSLRQDALSRHLHEGRGRPQDQLARIQSPGMNLFKIYLRFLIENEQLIYVPWETSTSDT